MEVTNPFNDPEFKKSILAKEGKLGVSSTSDDYELLEDSANGNGDLRSIITGAPSLPKSARNMILDASAISKNEKEQKAKEMELALNNILTSYNKTYGLDVNLDLHSLSNTLAIVATDPTATRALELYTSRIYRNVKAVLSLHLIQRLSLVIDYVTKPENMLSKDELSLPDMFLVIEKLISYIDTLGQLKSELQIKGDELELEKLAEENKEVDFNSETNKEAIDNFMALFNKEHGIG